MAGALFETACIAEFIKRLTALSDPASLYFYRSSDGVEVDLIIETAKNGIPIEMKLSSTLKDQHLYTLKKWLNLSSFKGSTALIISTSIQTGMIRSNIYNCHFSWI